MKNNCQERGLKKQENTNSNCNYVSSPAEVVLSAAMCSHYKEFDFSSTTLRSLSSPVYLSG